MHIHLKIEFISQLINISNTVSDISIITQQISYQIY